MTILNRFTNNSVKTLVDASTIVIDAEDAPHYQVTITANRTLGNPSNPTFAKELWLAIAQDVVGGHTLTFDTDWIAVDANGILNKAPGAISVVHATARNFGSGIKWYYSIDSTVTTGGSGNGLTIVTMADLAMVAGQPGNIVTVLGFYYANDQGGGEFYWVPGGAETPLTGMVVDAPGGQWKRLLGNKNFFRNVRWFGAKGDNVQDDTAAINEAIISTGPFSWGAEVYIPSGTYKVTDTIRWEFNTAATWANCRLFGDNPGGRSFPGTRLMWHGPPTHPTFSTPATSIEPFTNGSVMCQFNAFDSVVESIVFAVEPGFSCGCLVNLGHDVSPTSLGTVNQIKFIHCGFSGGSGFALEQDPPVLPSGTADYGLVWDFWNNGADANTEDCSVEDCGFGGLRQAALWFRVNTQPYGTVIQRCFGINAQMRDPNLPDYEGNESYGTFVRNDTTSLSLTLQDTDLQRWGCMFFMNNAPSSVKVINCHTETVKKLWYSPGSGTSLLGAVSFDGGRYANHFNYQSYGPGGPCDTAWPASDDRAFVCGGDLVMNITNCSFQTGYSESPMTIVCQGGDLIASGNYFPNINPFTRNPPIDPAHRGRTFSTGNSGTDSTGRKVTLPPLRGALNPAGSVTISDSATTAAVVFAHGEWVYDAFASPMPLSYWVSMTVQTVTGAAVVTTPYISSYTFSGFVSTGFIIALPTAPGAGNSVTIAYDIHRTL